MGKMMGFMVIGIIVVTLFAAFPKEMTVAAGIGVVGIISAQIFKK